MAQVMKYTHKSKEQPVFRDTTFVGKIVENDEDDEVTRTVNFWIMHFGGVGESGDCKVHINNVKVGDFTDVTLVDVGEGRYDLELENGYLLYHLIPEE